MAAHQAGRLDEAERLYRAALAADARNWNALTNLGTIFLQRGNAGEGVRLIQASLGVNPRQPRALNNLASVLRAQGQLAGALARLDAAVEIDPTYVDGWSNRGLVLHALGRPEDAIKSYDRALALQPNAASVRSNKALTLLLQGDFAAGWPLFEARLDQPDVAVARFAHPRWTGAEPIAGRIVLLHAEQGFGDTIQMLRYVPLVADLGAHVILCVQRPLLELAATVRGADVVTAQGDPLLPFDLHCPLMSLPLAFATSNSTVPDRTPYLAAPAEARARWSTRLGSADRPRIGLAWSGRPTHANDANRSLPLERLSPLLDLSVDFVSLQAEYRPADAAWLQACGCIQDLSAQLHSFGETAAVIEQLDLVVSVDTSVAHLAGALGRPLLVLLPHVPDFRWQMRGAATPWYPSATLLRQSAPGDWASVMAELVPALRQRLGV